MDLVTKLLTFYTYRGIPVDLVQSVLQECENDVNIAIQILTDMGFEKEDVLSTLKSEKHKEDDWTCISKRDSKKKKEIIPKTKKEIPPTEKIIEKLSDLKYTKHGKERSIERNVSIENIKETIEKAAKGIGKICIQEDDHLKFSYAYEFGEVHVVTDYELTDVISVWIREL